MQSRTKKSFIDLIDDAFFYIQERLLPKKILPNEKMRVVLEGSKESVRALRAADRKIGWLMREFRKNNTRLPEQTIVDIQELVKRELRHAPHVKHATFTQKTDDGEDQQLKTVFLKYAHHFRNEDGIVIEQPIITLQIGDVPTMFSKKKAGR